MEKLKQFFTDDLIKAITSDGVDFIGTYVPIPRATLQVIFKNLVKHPTYKFIRWKFEDWKTYYYREKNVVYLPWNGNSIPLPQVVVLDNIQEKRKEKNILFHLKEKEFEIPHHIRDLTETSFEELKKSLTYFNEENLRLCYISRHTGKIILHVQPVNYENFLHSNLLMDAQYGKKGSLREFLHSRGKLETLKNSPLANHLGINILIFTANGSLIMGKRSNTVAFRRGELSPSVSGAVSLTDIFDSCSLENMHKIREGFEELGIPRSALKDNSIHFLGITRELIRGGKPEMFFFINTNLSESDAKKKWEKAKDKWENQDLLFFHFGECATKSDLSSKKEKTELLKKINEFMKLHGENTSLPLLTNLALWVQKLTI